MEEMSSVEMSFGIEWMFILLELGFGNLGRRYKLGFKWRVRGMWR